MDFLKTNFSLLLLTLLMRQTLQRGQDSDPSCLTKTAPHVLTCCQTFRDDEFSESKCFDDVSLNSEELDGSECQIECFMKEQGYMDESGEVDLDAVDAYLDKTYNGDKYPEYVKAIQKAYRTCYQLKAAAPIINKRMRTKCSTFATLLWTCASQEVFLHCPKSHWKSSKTCDKVKRLVKQCRVLNMFKK